MLEVLAMPSQRPEGPLRPGDWMLRAVPGTGDVGHVPVLASDDLLAQPMLASEGIATESMQPGHYGLVIEAGAFPHTRSRPFARRWLNSRGCVPRHSMILRTKYHPQVGAISEFPPNEPEKEGMQRAIDTQEQPLEERFDPSAIPPNVADALGRKDWPLALKLAIQAGSRDENELTNLIFFARHPELPPKKLDPKDPNFDQLSSEWSRIQDREVWRAIQASAENTDLVVSGEEVADHHRRFFGGTSGKRLKTLVENAAREVDLNPGLLGTIMMAETRRPESYLSSEKVSSYLIGVDDFFEARAAIQARVPAYARVKWDKKQKPIEHPNDAKTNRRVVKTIWFDSGPDAVLATAVYVKFREVRLREMAAELGGDFDTLPLATQMALTRIAMAAGTGGATRFLKKALKGRDIFVRKAIPVAAYQTQRNATVRTAQAMHLSDWVFGIPVSAAAAQPELEAFEDLDDAVDEFEEEPGSGGTLAPRPLVRPDFWPDAVYIAKANKDNFLSSAGQFHKLWGLGHAEFESFERLIGLIAKAKSPEKRIRVISHGADGFIIPLFNGSPVGFTVTQEQIEALNDGDGALMDQLLGKLVDLDIITSGGSVAWNALLVQLESSSPDALKPFKLTSKTKPQGNVDLLLRRCADLIAVASADPVFTKAVRKSIAGARDRLRRDSAEVNALEAAVRASGFSFTMLPQKPQDMKDIADRLRVAVGALDDRGFRNTLNDARTKLKGKWLDFRGCRIGDKPKYLEALAKFMGTDGCTAPDWWSGYPGEVPINDKQVPSVDFFEGLVNSSTAAETAMTRWGARVVTAWNSVATADKPKRFFNDFLVAQNGVFPVFEVNYSGAAPKEKHTLFWNSSNAKQRWLESMWDRAPKKQVQLVARVWGAKTPPMPALSKLLQEKEGSQANRQEIYVVPEPEFRDHIIEVKKP